MGVLIELPSEIFSRIAAEQSWSQLKACSEFKTMNYILP